MKPHLELQPLQWRQACHMVTALHRHHPPSRGWLFGIAARYGDELVGVICVGRPVAQAYQDGWTCEATRCATDGTMNANSKLYAAASPGVRRARWGTAGW